ncbi:dedicator of cytokinesis protein 3 [Anopheles ziemanni]|uniref:dedicator of cytokinesis protein 3 n=1 Tax=Anopheles coustani TaxID=139045 RepID=UPI00265B14F5|nr:dedicator of cytokinesis protein 3 [Anopheles coustani]XP_058172576.1 dedicator of cytokinesis protein 3 [Anopheles ziemanni]
MIWTPTSNKYGVAIHNWHGDVTHGLALDVGDCVEILEETTYWFRGTCPRKPRKVGLFPKSYIHLKDLSKVDPVVAECTLVLREWSEIWKRLFVEREEYKFTSLRKVMLALLESRRELLSSTLTQDQTYDLQMKVISKIDWGNRKLGLDLVPRLGTLAVDPQKIGIVSLHQVHVSSAENAKAAANRATQRKKADKNINSHHLYFCMRDFGHRIGDDAEIFFYLYDGNTNRMRALSERFLVRIARDGFSTYVDMSHNCTIFTDLGTSDLNQDLYLIANVMRVGKMLHSESVKKGDKLTATTHAYRRPYGVGVLPLNEIAQFDTSVESEEKEFSFKIFQCEEKEYHQLHELIIKKASGKFQPINASTQGHYGLVVSMKLLHGEISQVKQEQPVLFQGTAITKKIGFPDVIMPGDVRNDLFLTLERGEFERVGISTAKNIEITALVLDEHGRIVQECIAIASGGSLQASYKSMVLYHNNSPAWNETIRMFVPIDKFSKAHVRFEFRSCSTRDKSDPKLFGFSFARLMEPGGATIADGAHELYVYKCEDFLKVQASVYLRLPCSAGDRQAVGDSPSPYHRSLKEAFYVRTILCSTKLTQNGDLLSLLQWRNRPEGIQDSLQRVLRLHNEELIKFLQDVLDALFALFSTDDGNSTPHSGLVFHVLVNIFSLMQSNKFQHFKPVMDAYIRDHFAAPLVYQGLLSSVQHLADWLTTTDNLEPIVQCFSSLEFIFKLIIQSRKLFAHASGGQYEDKFKNDLFSVFTSLNGMLSVPSTTQILATQEKLLSNAGVVFEQLRTIITPPELEALVKSMLDAVPKDAQSPLIKAKLKTIKDLVSGQLFQDDELRSMILNIACKHLRVHLARRDELLLCSEILAEVLIKLYEAKAKTGEKPSNAIHHDLDTLFVNIFPILLQTITVLSNGGNENLICPLFAVKLGLLQLLDEMHYQRMWDRQQSGSSPSAAGGSLGTGKDLRDFIHQCLAIFKDMLEQDWMIFSKDWLVMKMAANDVLRRTLEELAKPLVYRFLGPQSFDSQLWWSYFSVAVIFLTQPSLQIEQYHETKRRKILSIHGDMRVMMGFQILSMWAQLGEHKLHFIPSMVGPFLEVTLVPEPALRKATFTVFYDMMQCEQVSRGSFRLVESELIDKLDLLISENKGDDEYRELFSTMEQLCLALLERVQTENPSWRESGIAFISSVTRLLERLLDYRSVMQGDENRDKRMTCTVNLLNFYNDEINRKEMYVRYIYKLLDLHLGAENYVEAGLTLKLYADMLSWDSEHISDESNGPREWEQKEKSYKNIICYFDKGKCWEKGIPLCKELAMFYERKRFDYNRLSEMLMEEARFFQNILTQLRPEPEYFRVGYYGTGFPSFVRNKQFIYRGLEYERIGAFIQRLQTEFPTAQILDKKQYPPDSSILNSPEQRFHAVNVRPIPDPYHLKSAKVTVPEKISKYYEVNDVTRFQYDRPVHKGTVDKDNEFKSLWIVRTIYETAQPLPGILRWLEVSKTSEHELTPVEFACETIANVNKELSDLIVQYRLDPKRNLNPFTMRIQGSVDANVNGGFSKYQDAFFSERFAKSTEGRDQSVHVQRLKRLIYEQMQILRQALELHRSLASEQVLPLHNRLSEAFHELEKSTAEWKTNINIPTKPLPPLPIGQQSTGTSTGSSHYQSVGPSNGRLPSNGGQEMVYFPEDYDGTYMSVTKKGLSLSGIVPIGTLNASAMVPQIPPRDSTGGLPAVCSPTAPPLPPRGHTPDKRSSNPMPFTEYVEQQQQNQHQQQQPQQGQTLPGKGRQKKYSLYEISLNDSGNYGSPRPLTEFRQGFNRDSGISTSTQELNNLNVGEAAAHYHHPVAVPPPPETNSTTATSTPHDDYNISANGNTLQASLTRESPILRGHQKTNSNPEAYQCITPMAQTRSPTAKPPPPPIPPKSATLHHQHSLPAMIHHNNSSSSSNNNINNNASVHFYQHQPPPHHHQHQPPHHHHHHQRNQSLNLSTNSSSDGEQLSLNDISPAPPPMFNDNFSDSFSDDGDNPVVALVAPPQIPKLRDQSPGRSGPSSAAAAAGGGVGFLMNGGGASGEVLEMGSITTTTTTTTIISLRRDDEDEIFY